MLAKKKSKFKTLTIVISSILIIALALLTVQWYSYIASDNFKIVKDFIKSKLDKQGYEIFYKEVAINPSLIPSITLKNVVFKNKASETGDNLFEAQELDINFELLPILLKKQLKIDFLNVQHGKIFIKRDRDGNNNWFRSAQSSSSGSRFSLGSSFFSEVEIYYSGPTFLDKKITIEEAQIAYLADGSLLIESSKGRLDDYQFLMKGNVESIDSFIKGKGAKLDLNLNLDELASLELSGYLGSTTYPTEQGLEFKVSGSNLAVLAKKIISDVSSSTNAYFSDDYIPITDDFFMQGRIYSNGSELNLDISDSSFVRDENSIQLKGSVLKKKNLIIDIFVKAQGEDVTELGEGLALSENLLMYLPKTDHYMFQAIIGGELKHLAANISKAELGIANHSVQVEGQIGDINQLHNMVLAIELIGSDLEELKELALANMPMSFPLPRTESYQLKFSIDGGVAEESKSKIEQLKFSDVDLEMVFPNNHVKLESYRQTFFSLPDVQIKVTTSGDDIFQLLNDLNIDLDRKSIADIRHDMSFLLAGNLYTDSLAPLENYVSENTDEGLAVNIENTSQTLSISELNADLAYQETDIQLQGSVSNLKALQNIDLNFNISGFENHLSALLELDEHPAKQLQANGHFQGGLKEFSISNFSYMGDRGHSSGDLSIILNNKPEVKARLGDTRIVFETEEKEIDTGNVKNEKTVSFAWMDNLNLDAHYESLFIVFNAIEFEILGGNISMQNGLMNWSPLQVVYKEVTINTDLFINANSDELRFSANAMQLDLGALMKDFDWFTRFVGLADIDFSFESKGQSDKEIIANLTGKGKLIFHNGKITNFGSASMSYVQALTPWRKSVADLELECLLSTIDINKGVVNFEHLFVENKDLYLTGGGKVNLNNYTMDLAISPRAKNKSFLNANVSLFVTGPLAEPQVKVGKLSAISDVGLKYGQWALLGPLSLALPKLKLGQTPSCEQAIKNL